jgi:uncharacterized protein YndB with AHSA1/START domain
MSEYGKAINKSSIQFERLLPGPIERVWAYLTEPEKRAEWFAGGVTELKPGGRAEFIFNHSELTTPDDKPPEKFEKFTGEMRFEGKVVQVDPPRLLVWQGADGRGDYTVTKFELAPKGDKVLLTLSESRLTPREKLIGNAVGWHTHLEVLEAKLAGEEPPPFWATHSRLTGEYEQRLGA